MEINMDKALQKYTRKFSKLRQGVTKYGPAPHKPVLPVQEHGVEGNEAETKNFPDGSIDQVARPRSVQRSKDC